MPQVSLLSTVASLLMLVPLFAGAPGEFYQGDFFTGFEASEGFVEGFIGGQPGSADDSTNWVHGATGSEVEGSIRSVVPASGSQHLSLGYDPELLNFPIPFGGIHVDAAVPASSVAEASGQQLIPRAYTFSADIYIGDQVGSRSLTLALNSVGAGLVSTRVRWDQEFGADAAELSVFVPGSPCGSDCSIGSWTRGVYQRLRISADPCTRTIRYYVDDELRLCSSPYDDDNDGFSDACGAPWAPSDALVALTVNQLFLQNHDYSPGTAVFLDNISYHLEKKSCFDICPADATFPLECASDAHCRPGEVCRDCRCEPLREPLGACCDREFTTCTEGVSRPACDSSFAWVEGAMCEEIDCVFLVIPAASEWSLGVLALSLLILAKMGSIRAARGV